MAPQVNEASTIINQACQLCHISVLALQQGRRGRAFTRARCLIVWRVLCHYPHLPYHHLALLLGLRAKSTVARLRNTCLRNLELEKDFRADQQRMAA